MTTTAPDAPAFLRRHGLPSRAAGAELALRAPDASIVPAPAQHELAAQVLQQYRVVLKKVKAHFQHVERATGVGGTQVWALSAIRNQPGIGVGALARALSVKQPTASVLVRNLVQRGLVEARKDAHDRRAVELHVLAPGQQVLDRAPGPAAGRLPQALAEMDRQALERMQADLARLIALLGEDTEAGSMPLTRL